MDNPETIKDEVTEDETLENLEDVDNEPDDIVDPYEQWNDDERSDRDRAADRLYYGGYGDMVGLDPFAYDSSGNDTGLRQSDFI